MAVSVSQQWVAAMSQALSRDEKSYFKALGARVAQRRQEVGLTQVQLADALGTAQQTLAAYEVGRNRIPVSLLPDLARTLRTDINTLLGETAKAAKRGPAPKFQHHMERIGKLPKARQRMVIEVLESLLAQQGA